MLVILGTWLVILSFFAIAICTVWGTITMVKDTKRTFKFQQERAKTEDEFRASQLARMGVNREKASGDNVVDIDSKR